MNEEQWKFKIYMKNTHFKYKHHNSITMYSNYMVERQGTGFVISSPRVILTDVSGEPESQPISALLSTNAWFMGVLHFFSFCNSKYCYKSYHKYEKNVNLKQFIHPWTAKLCGLGFLHPTFPMSVNTTLIIMHIILEKKISWLQRFPISPNL